MGRWDEALFAAWSSADWLADPSWIEQNAVNSADDAALWPFLSPKEDVQDELTDLTLKHPPRYGPSASRENLDAEFPAGLLISASVHARIHDQSYQDECNSVVRCISRLLQLAKSRDNITVSFMVFFFDAAEGAAQQWANTLATRQLVVLDGDRTACVMLQNFALQALPFFTTTVKPTVTEIQLGGGNSEVSPALIFVSAREQFAEARRFTSHANPWQDPQLPYPLRPDILDDIRGKLASLADEYKFLLADFQTEVGDAAIGKLLGPDPRQNDRAGNRARGSVQCGSHLSKAGLPMLISEETPMEQHISAGRLVDHPFAGIPSIPLDLQFAVRRAYSAPERTAIKRAETLSKLEEAAGRCSEFNALILDRMDKNVRLVAGNMNVAFVVFLIHLLNWPDWSLGDQFTKGFSIVGDVPRSNIFRSVRPKAEMSEEQLLQEADAWNSSLEADVSPSNMDDAILEASRKEQRSGILGRFGSKKDMDRRFGVGRWRGIRRRAVDQHGKIRAIDNCKKSGTNLAAWIDETIHTVPQDIAVLTLIYLCRTLSISHVELAARHPAIGADDLEAAYRGVPNLPDHLRFAVVAVRHPGGTPGRGQGRRAASVKFAVCAAHLFGMSAAVANFNRLPELLTAASRRLGASPTWHFFDDQGSLVFGTEDCSAQYFTARLYKLAGRPFQQSKHLAPSQGQVHLGLINDLTKLSEGFAALRPKPEKKRQVLQNLERWSGAHSVSEKELAQLIGDINYLSTACFGRVAKGGIQALRKAASTGGHTVVRSCLWQSLMFFTAVLKHLQERRIPLVYPSRKHVSVYSDAAWEPSENETFTGMGAVIFSSIKRQAAAGEAPKVFVNGLSNRKTQIIPLELLAAIAAMHTWEDLLKGQLVIIWIDNQSVCAAIASGASAAEDLHALVAGLHWFCAERHIGLWVEWLPSDTNPADQPSRSGVSSLVPETINLRFLDWCVNWRNIVPALSV